LFQFNLNLKVNNKSTVFATITSRAMNGKVDLLNVVNGPKQSVKGLHVLSIFELRELWRRRLNELTKLIELVSRLHGIWQANLIPWISTIAALIAKRVVKYPHSTGQKIIQNNCQDIAPIVGRNIKSSHVLISIDNTWTRICDSLKCSKSLSWVAGCTFNARLRSL